jgi:hypothetical protein
MGLGMLGNNPNQTPSQNVKTFYFSYFLGHVQALRLKGTIVDVLHEGNP